MASTDADTATDYISQMILGAWRPRALAAGAQLGVPDAIGEGRATSEDVAARTGADPRSVLRLLRALTIIGVCRHHGGTEFELTEAGRLLQSDVPGSLHAHATLLGNRVWPMFTNFDDVVRTGGRAVTDEAAGFDELASDPDARAALYTALALESVTVADELTQIYDFGRYHNVVDVGGGYGGFLCALLKKYPNMTGQVLDLPLIAAETTRYLDAAGLGARAQFVEGDFFKEVPAGAEAYILKYIVHDWDDDKAVEILKSCRKAAGASGAILLIERVVPDVINGDAVAREVIGSDLVMMNHGGLERTAAEYGALMSQAGLELFQVTPSASGYCVLEAVAARSDPQELPAEDAAREGVAEGDDRETV